MRPRMAGSPDDLERAAISAQNDQALAASFAVRGLMHDAAEKADVAVRALVEEGGDLISDPVAITVVLQTLHIHLLNCWILRGQSPWGEQPPAPG